MPDSTPCPHGSHRSYCLECIEGPNPAAELIEQAVRRALALAEQVASTAPGDAADRGIDVGFSTQADAEQARTVINERLRASRWAGQLEAWVWTPRSTGEPLTDAGSTHGREIRLAPQRQS